jgi:hypothetical protein
MGLLRPHRAVAPAPHAPTDARGDHARPPPPGVKSTYDYLQTSELRVICKDYTTPFLLEALERRNSIAITHDRSACSCVKDFGSPTLVKLNDDEHAMDKSLLRRI